MKGKFFQFLPFDIVILTYLTIFLTNTHKHNLQVKSFVKH